MQVAQPVSEEPTGDLPYMYAIILLHKAGRPVKAKSIEHILAVAGVPYTLDDIPYMEWLERQLEGEDIEFLMNRTIEQHPIPIVDRILTEEEPEEEPEVEEEPDEIWKRLFG